MPIILFPKRCSFFINQRIEILVLDTSTGLRWFNKEPVASDVGSNVEIINSKKGRSILAFMFVCLFGFLSESQIGC